MGRYTELTGLPYEIERRVVDTLALHHPDPICQAHHTTISPTHTCAGPLLYRCASCARTAPQPCRTWRTLTGKDSPDADTDSA